MEDSWVLGSEGYEFYGCSNLKKVILPNNLKEIGFESFGLTAIEQIEVPINATRIDFMAFGLLPLKCFEIPEKLYSWGIAFITPKTDDGQEMKYVKSYHQNPEPTLI